MSRPPPAAAPADPCFRCSLWAANPRDLPGWGRCDCKGTQANPAVIAGKYRVQNAVLSTTWESGCGSFRPKEPTT